MRAILINPRYTGYQVWGKQRRDEVLVDLDDVGAGHDTLMRWNDATTWTWSHEPVHEPLITQADFAAVQTIIASNSRSRGPRSRQAGTRTYPLRGRLTCGACGRLMQGHQARGQHHYRCRYTAEYARSTALPHPLNVYLREDDLLGQIDEWLADLLSPERLDATLNLLLDDEQDPSAPARDRLEEELRTCDRKIAKYRALLDEGVDPSLIAAWLKETSASRQLSERRLADLLTDSKTPFAERAILREALIDLGGMRSILAKGDQRDRAKFYEAVGISGLYQPQDNAVILTTQPVGHMVRVGGGT